ncbi:hypothetical protein M0R45_005512 [Rubus argutus]|uniref:Uncharacterized protein n=1 Tax=Rubus argutus TaxID=59490 RepID=A0AAW1YNG5_RUBAR
MAAEAPSSSCSSSSRSNVYHHHHHHHQHESSEKAFTESDLAAAEQLMQLSDDSGGNKKRNRSKAGEYETDEEGVEYQSPLSVITCAKIEEIFGKDDELEYLQKKRRRYRSLADVYLTTKPIRT